MPRDSDLAKLHPDFRWRAEKLVSALESEKIPFRLFEGFRTPQRQRELYAQGRTTPGGIVTKAKPWQSYHQYGLAADFVLHIDDKWNWDDSGKRRSWWKRLHEIAHEIGLETLSWELPHVQLDGLRIDSLWAGHYPPNGDTSWARNLEAAIESWTGAPPTLGLPRIGETRPPLQGSADVGRESTAPGPSTTYRVIARGGLRLRSGPGIEYDVIGNLMVDQEVQLLASRNDWALIDVQGDSHADGYCHRGFLKAST